ncbi:MAG TPA: RnfABCDGE type electron transport complex subunit D [Chitinophagales bacterium]|nr:RnfABCDGE type electron transport complex subunit D [Chitinophagales bacterium]
MQLLATHLPGKKSTIHQWINNFTTWFTHDPRLYQITFLSCFLGYGVSSLHWDIAIPVFAAAFCSCLVMQNIFIVCRMSDLHSLKSAIISALSLCLLLRTNDVVVMLFAGALSISSKFIFRITQKSDGVITASRKHFFNPTNFGIITTILITGSAWISPGQWGSNGILLFCIGILGFAVLLKVKRLDIAITFFSVFCMLSFIRSVVVVGWSTDVFFHQFTSGTLLLFTFFMITDPVSTPSHKTARIIWATLVAMLAFYLATYEFVNGAPLWALFFLSPTTVLFDKFFLHPKFSWL